MSLQNGEGRRELVLPEGVSSQSEECKNNRSRLLSAGRGAKHRVYILSVASYNLMRVDTIIKRN